jgi:hypothetical protein
MHILKRGSHRFLRVHPGRADVCSIAESAPNYRLQRSARNELGRYFGGPSRAPAEPGVMRHALALGEGFMLEHRNHWFVTTVVALWLSVSQLVATGRPYDVISPPLDASLQPVAPNETRHRYTRGPTSETTGFIPFRGWQGCPSQAGTWYSCSDGETVYFVKKACTRPRGARADLAERLKPLEAAWRATQTCSLGDATLIELATPLEIRGESMVEYGWACLWVADNTMYVIYATDEEHALDFYERARNHRGNPWTVLGA